MTPPSFRSTTDLPATAKQLLGESDDDDLGAISPSVYETARIVSIAPWLDGHADRLRFLRDSQVAGGEAAGTWGDPDHWLVPTLSATEALLATLARPEQPSTGAPSHTELARVVHRGLEQLGRRLTGRAAAAVSLPDTIAVELIVPALIAHVNEHLDDPGPFLGDLLPDWCEGLQLGLPQGCEPALLARLRQAPAHSLPEKLWHSWEAIAPVGARSPHVQLVGGGLSCSPAATATWLGQPADADHPSARYLHRVQHHYGGPVPVSTPIDTFEIAWSLSTLANHRVPHTPATGLLDRLRAALTERGAPAGAGLPPDPDTTGVVLQVLAFHGQDVAPDVLMQFFTGDHFYTFREERNASISSNAHALEALRGHVARHPEHQDRYEPVIGKVVDWLISHQHEDGYWTDKWHASPYYATACCTQALALHGGHRAAAALVRAASWAVATQQSNGRWGHGGGTVEETAYAVWIINHDETAAQGTHEALDAARTALQDGEPTDDANLWYGKDLYTLHRLLRVTHLAALHTLDHRHPRVDRR